MKLVMIFILCFFASMALTTAWFDYRRGNHVRASALALLAWTNIFVAWCIAT